MLTQSGDEGTGELSIVLARHLRLQWLRLRRRFAARCPCQQHSTPAAVFFLLFSSVIFHPGGNKKSILQT